MENIMDKRQKKLPALRGDRVTEGARTLDPQNHNLML